MRFGPEASPDWYRRPELILAQLLQREAMGLGEQRVLLRATVLAVDSVGGKLENPGGNGTIEGMSSDGRPMTYQASVGPENPVGSVKARILTDGLDRVRGDQDVKVFWPLLPQDHLSIPISPGEHIYALFEDRDMEHGLWLGRVSGQDSGGVYLGSDSYTAPSGRSSAMDNFEGSGGTYPSDDGSASLAPSRGAMASFEGDG